MTYFISCNFNGKLPNSLFIYTGNGLLISQNPNTSVIYTIVTYLDKDTTFEINGKFALKIGRF
jgi:hypothetical protein